MLADGLLRRGQRQSEYILKVDLTRLLKDSKWAQETDKGGIKIFAWTTERMELSLNDMRKASSEDSEEIPWV